MDVETTVVVAVVAIKVVGAAVVGTVVNVVVSPLPSSKSIKVEVVPTLD